MKWLLKIPAHVSVTCRIFLSKNCRFQAGVRWRETPCITLGCWKRSCLRIHKDICCGHPHQRNTCNDRTCSNKEERRCGKMLCTRITFSQTLMVLVGDLATPVWYLPLPESRLMWHHNLLLLTYNSGCVSCATSSGHCINIQPIQDSQPYCPKLGQMFQRTLSCNSW